MAEKEKEDSGEKKNLETVDFNNRRDRVQTAHSKKAILELGLDESKLYRIEKEQYLLQHPELKNASEEVQDKRYDHYEQRRQDQIDEARKKRSELIEKENEEYKESESKENDIKKNYDTGNNEDEEPQSEAIKKELEKLEMMKKQQLGEIKNIIDYAYKMEEFRKKNQEKMRIQEEKEEKLREEKEKQKKEKEELQKKKEEEKKEK